MTRTRRELLKLGAVCAGLSIAGCTGRDVPDFQDPITTDWSMPLADAGNTANNGETGFPVADITPRWMGTDGGTDVDESPLGVAVSNGHVYATYRRAGLVRHDAEDGAVGFQVAFEGARPAGPPVLGDDGGVIVPRDDDSMTKVTGSGGWNSTPGEIEWTVTASDLGWEALSTTVGTAATEDGSFVVAGSDAAVAEIDVADGSVIGGDGTPNGGDWAERPPVVTDRMIVVSTSERVRGVRRADDYAETFDVSVAARTPPVHYAGRALVGTDRGLACLDATPDGELAEDVERREDTDHDRILWEEPIDGRVTGALARTGNVAVVPTDAGLRGYSASAGNRRWALDAVPASDPVLSGGIGYVVTDSGTLLVFDAMMGARLAETDLPTAKPDRLGIDGDRLVATGVESTDAESVDVGGGEAETTDEGTSHVAFDGSDDVAGAESLLDPLRYHFEELEARTVNDVVPRTGPEPDDEFALVARAEDLVEQYENGEIPFRVARGILERTFRAARQMHLLVGLVHHESAGQGEMVGTDESEAITKWQTPGGYEEHALSPNPQRGYVPSPVENDLSGASLGGWAGVSVGRFAIALLTALPLLKIGKGVGSVLGVGGKPALRQVFKRREWSVGGVPLYDVLEQVQKVVQTARSSIEDAKAVVNAAQQADLIPRIIGRYLEEVLDGLIGTAVTIVGDEADDEFLDGAGMRFLTNAVYGVFISLVGDHYINGVEANPRVVDDPEFPRKDYPDDPNVHDGQSMFPGYTVRETLTNLDDDEVFDDITRVDQLPGNRSSSSMEAARTYRDALRGASDTYASGQALKIELPEEVQFDLGEYYDLIQTARTEGVFSVDTLAAAASAYQQQFNLLFEIGTDVIQGYLDIAGGLEEWRRTHDEITRQLKLGHEVGFENSLYGRHDAEGI